MKYNDLFILHCKSAEEESATEIKINESIVQLEGYTTRVTEVRSTDIAAFREIEAIVNPPPTVTLSTRGRFSPTSRGLSSSSFLMSVHNQHKM